MHNAVAVLTAVVDAAAFKSAEKQKLVALVQSRRASDDDDSELFARAAAAYVSHTSGHCGCAQRFDGQKSGTVGRKCATLNQVPLTTSPYSGSLSRTSHRNITNALSKVKADNSKLASSL